MKINNKLSEYQECKFYYEWAELNAMTKGNLVKHVNEGKRSNLLGRLLNLIGLRKGFPDYQLCRANKNWHGFFLEMKVRDEKGKKQKKEQMEWINKLRKNGYYANFAYGFEDAIDQTINYLNDRI